MKKDDCLFSFDAYDHEFASYIMRRCKLDCGCDELLFRTSMLLTHAMTSRGDVCLELEKYTSTNMPFPMPPVDEWRERLLTYKTACSSANENTFPMTPFVIAEGNRLYLQKYYLYEKTLCDALLARTGKTDTCVFPDSVIKQVRPNAFASVGDDGVDGQKYAVFNTLSHKLSVIAGGPGTGKTTVVAACLALEIMRNPDMSIALAAPTGKAKARLLESLRSEMESLDITNDVRTKLDAIEAYTLHSLLKIDPVTSESRLKGMLDYDIIVLDEGSMIHLSLFAKFMKAVSEDTKLVILGDKYQLSSVEAGSVFAGICSAFKGNIPDDKEMAKEYKRLANEDIEDKIKEDVRTENHPLSGNISFLTYAHRFSGTKTIGKISSAIRNLDNDGGKFSEIKDLSDEIMSLNTPEFKVIEGTASELEKFIDNIFSIKNSSGFCMKDMKRLAGSGDSSNLAEAAKLMDFVKILAPVRNGVFGTVNINATARKILGFGKGLEAGLPLMILENTHSLGLANGDTGFLCSTNKNRTLNAFFPENDIMLNPASLPAWEDAMAMTVHKSQGSGFENVFCVFPAFDNGILSRELVYTAITRAKKHVTLFVPERKMLEIALMRSSDRSSALSDMLKKGKFSRVPLKRKDII